jgi:hypothetical protein
VRETLAALGVIASMVFVGLEIRQNNNLAQAAAYQAIGIASAEAWDNQAHDREFLQATQSKAPAAMVTIDWTQKEAVRADMRRKVKRLLRKHGYPPDKQAEAVLTVIEQAERVCRDWSRAA